MPASSVISSQDSESRTLSPPPEYHESWSDQPLVELDNPLAAGSSFDQPADGNEIPISNEALAPVHPPRAPLPPIPEPVVLTWTPDPPASAPRTSSSNEPALPRASVTYSFSQVGTHSMLLIPPSTSSDTRPVYHISWREDYFLPGNLITTVRRGGNEDGRFVGEYDLKGGRSASTVRIGSNEARWVGEVIKRTSSRHTKWQFNASSPLFYWDHKNLVETCLLGAVNGRPVARFVAPAYYTRNPSTQVAKLEVMPAGHTPDIFDEIVLSALLMERQRIIEKLRSN